MSPKKRLAGPPNPRPTPLPRITEDANALKRSIPYKGFAIELFPDDALGVKGQVVQLTAPGHVETLHEVTYRNEFPVFVKPGDPEEGQTTESRSSYETAGLALRDCKGWIDERVAIEEAIGAVEVEKP